MSTDSALKFTDNKADIMMPPLQPVLPNHIAGAFNASANIESTPRQTPDAAMQVQPVIAPPEPIEFPFDKQEMLSTIRSPGNILTAGAQGIKASMPKSDVATLGDGMKESIFGTMTALASSLGNKPEPEVEAPSLIPGMKPSPTPKFMGMF